MDEYRSPIRLVLHAGESAEPYNAQAISRARKKMLAELSLSGDELIIEEISYSRNDIVTLLDGTNSEANWPAHNFIYTYKSLLNFLEKKEFTSFFTAYIPEPEAAQAEFISRYFAHSFEAVSRQQLRTQDFTGLEQLLSSQRFIDAADSHAAYYSIRVYFDDINYLLRNLNWEKYERDKSVLDFLYIHNFSTFVNALPPSFNGTRDNLVLQVILLVERLQHKETWSNLRKICQQLQGIDCSPHLKEEVDKFERIMDKNARSVRFSINKSRSVVDESRSSRGSSGSGRGVWTIIWIIIVIGRFIMVGNSCNSSRSSDGLDYSTMRSLSNMWHQAEMNSRNADEINVKKLIGDLAGKTNIGTPIKPNFIKVFSGISHPPDTSASGRVIIVNNTSKDMIVLGFSAEQTVYDTTATFMAVRVPSKGSAFLAINPDFTRINIVMGNGWMKLRKPIFIDSANGKSRYLREYFRTTPEEQEYMKGELLFSAQEMNIEEAGDGSYSSMVYRPVEYTTQDAVKVTRLQFDEENNRIINPTIEGNLFIYRKKDRAYYREINGY